MQVLHLNLTVHQQLPHMLFCDRFRSLGNWNACSFKPLDKRRRGHWNNTIFLGPAGFSLDWKIRSHPLINHLPYHLTSTPYPCLLSFIPSPLSLTFTPISLSLFSHSPTPHPWPHIPYSISPIPLPFILYPYPNLSPLTPYSLSLFPHPSSFTLIPIPSPLNRYHLLLIPHPYPSHLIPYP